MSWNNNVTLIGRLTRDLEVGSTSKNKMYGRSSIAVDKSYKGADGQWVNKAIFVDIVIWGDSLVTSLKEKYKKGVLVSVQGELDINNYEAKDGTKRSSTSIKVVSQRVLENNKKTFSNGANQGAQNYDPAQDFANQTYDPSSFTAMDDDDGIPF